MKKTVIKLNEIYDISLFIEKASRVKEPGVIVRKGSVVLDGTSLIGMLSLDTKDGITVEYPDNEIEFETFIKEFKEK